MGTKYRRLRNRMKAQGMKSYELAKTLNITSETLSRKFHGAVPFTETEIEGICVALKINAIDIWQFFFERLTIQE